MLSVDTNQYLQLSDDYTRIEAALMFLQSHYLEQPSLGEIAAGIGLSEYHFQRLFTRWVGISPKRFLQFVTKEHAKTLLDNATPLMDAAYQTGLSGPGRLHDLFVKCEAVTPGEYKQHGAGLTIRYDFHPSPFGSCLLALTERGVCGLAFAASGGEAETLVDMQRRWKKARWIEDSAAVKPWVARIFPMNDAPIYAEPLPVVLHGTNFQMKVWEALLQVPPGRLITYQSIAAGIGSPQAARAVGQAVGANPIAYLIPCHRVIRKLGQLGGYHWGVARKQAILGWEMARRDQVYMETVSS